MKINEILVSKTSLDTTGAKTIKQTAQESFLLVKSNVATYEKADEVYHSFAMTDPYVVGVWQDFADVWAVVEAERGVDANDVWEYFHRAHGIEPTIYTDEREAIFTTPKAFFPTSWEVIRAERKQEVTAPTPRRGMRTDTEKFEIMYRFLLNHGIDITGNRARWIALGGMCRTMFGDSEGLEKWVGISQFYPKFSRQECERNFKTLASSGYGVNVLMEAMRREGLPLLRDLLLMRY